MAKHSKKWILEHYECENQMEIDDVLYLPEYLRPCGTCEKFDSINGCMAPHLCEYDSDGGEYHD